MVVEPRRGGQHGAREAIVDRVLSGRWPVVPTEWSGGLEQWTLCSDYAGQPYHTFVISASPSAIVT